MKFWVKGRWNGEGRAFGFVFGMSGSFHESFSPPALDPLVMIDTQLSRLVGRVGKGAGGVQRGEEAEAAKSREHGL